MDRFMNAIKADAGRMIGRQSQPRVGIVESIDATHYQARVRLMPEDRLTGWLPIGTQMVGAGVGIVSPPAPGQQVIMMPQEGDAEHWFVVGGSYSVQNLPPVSQATQKPVQPGEVGIFSSGASMHLVGDTFHIRAETLEVTATNTNITGDVAISGKLTVQGVVKSMADVLAKAVSLLDHLHGGVKSGGGNTGKPV